MSGAVKLTEVGKAINDVLTAYQDDVIEGVTDLVKKVSDEAKQEVQAGSPVRASGGGRYKRGWTVKDERKDRYHPKAIVHNRTDYQLAHLLEHGHIIRNKPGGRELGSTSAQPHIAPAEQNAIEKFEQGVEKIAGGG